MDDILKALSEERERIQNLAQQAEQELSTLSALSPEAWAALRKYIEAAARLNTLNGIEAVMKYAALQACSMRPN